MSDPAEPVRRLLSRYSRQSDPGDRAATMAELQRATGPALAELVAVWRESTGVEWSTVADRLGTSRTTLYRQLQAGAITSTASADREERRSA